MFNKKIRKQCKTIKIKAKFLSQLYRDKARLGGARLSRAAMLLPVLAIAACAGMPEGAPPPAASRMPLGPSTNPPMGAVLFCEANSSECLPQAKGRPQQVAMTPQRWDQLRSVQIAVDREIVPQATADIAWHYAQNGAGGCVQYALEKRRRLLSLGWPAAALGLATVVTPQNNRHLVLVVATNDGDWVLDNLRADLARWEDLPYHWRERQLGASLRDWVRVALNG
jgi:predicted transglutaminase-like cysteine proteinase